MMCLNLQYINGMYANFGYAAYSSSRCVYLCMVHRNICYLDNSIVKKIIYQLNIKHLHTSMITQYKFKAVRNIILVGKLTA